MIFIIIGAAVLLAGAVALSIHGDRVTNRMMEEEKKNKSTVQDQRKDQTANKQSSRKS